MTDEQLRAHIVDPSPLGHGQPKDDIVGATIDDLRSWHEWEHHLTYGSRGHVHDEISARRFKLPMAHL